MHIYSIHGFNFTYILINLELLLKLISGIFLFQLLTNTKIKKHYLPILDYYVCNNSDTKINRPTLHCQYNDPSNQLWFILQTQYRCNIIKLTNVLPHINILKTKARWISVDV